MSWTIDQAPRETSLPIITVIGTELARTFSLASNATFGQVVDGSDTAPEYYDITIETWQRGASAIAAGQIKSKGGAKSDTLTVGTADPFDVFRKILVVTQDDVDWLNFYELASEWKRSRRNTSAFGSDPRDPNYLRIIGMGPQAIPCILRQLRSEMLAGEPDHWFTALWAITGENPIPEESQGKIREMALAWLAWGDRRGRGNAEAVGNRISEFGW